MNKSAGFARMRIAVAVLIILLLAGVLSPQFTGWFSGVIRLDVGVAEEWFACLYFVERPHNAVQDSVQNITVDITNCGSRPLEGKLVVEIKDSSMNVVDTLNSSNYSLSPSQDYIFSTTWEASLPLGMYWIFARDDNTNTNSTNEINATFNITCVLGSRRCFGNNVYLCTDPFVWDFFESCSGGCENGACVAGQPSGGGGGGGAAVTPSIGMSLDYKKYIEAVQESEHTFIVKVTNNGSVYLHNLTISAEAEGIIVVPEKSDIERLSPGSSVFFVLNISVPRVDIGNYSLEFEVKAEEASAKGRVVVYVIKAEEFTKEDQCTSMINYYIDMVSSLNREITILEAKGENVTEVKRLLADVVREIDIAREYKNIGLYDNCVEQTDIIRRKIERVADAIALIVTRKEIPQERIAQPAINLYLVYVIIIAILLVMVIIAMIKAVRKYLKRRRLMMIEGRW